MFKLFYKIYYKLFPREMTDWWKTKDRVQAKLTTADDGSYIMHMDGEKYPFPGWPRGHLLYGRLSKLKHEIKTRIFNENWHKLERGEQPEIEDALEVIYELAEGLQYDMTPVEKCPLAIREFYRAFPNNKWRDILTYIFTEDDAYRFRFQWFFAHLSKKDPIGSFDRGMELLEHAEIVSDMKARVRLIRRVMMELFRDPTIARIWVDFVRNADFKKIKLTKADKYFMRAKYFKPDYKNPKTPWGRASNEVLY